jgi:hypothetical protein
MAWDYSPPPYAFRVAEITGMTITIPGLFVGMEVSLTLFLDWPLTTILLISTSGIVGI